MTGKVKISKFQQFSGIAGSLVAKSEILLQAVSGHICIYVFAHIVYG